MDILANVIGEMRGHEKQDELIRRKERRRALGGSDTSSIALIGHKSISDQSLKYEEAYLDLITEDLVAWLNDIYHIEIHLDNFYSSLDNGVLLCQHANNVVRLAKAYKPANSSPDAGGNGGKTEERVPTEAIFYRPQVPRGTTLARGNVDNFIDWCEHQLGISSDLLFHPEDLLHQTNRKRFLMSMMEVAKRGCRFGMRTPAVLALDASVEQDEKRIHKLQRSSKHGKLDVISITSCSWELIQDVDEKVAQRLRLCRCEKSKFLKQEAPGRYVLGHKGVRVYARKLRGRDVIKRSSDKNWWFLDQFFLNHDPCRQPKPSPPTLKVPESPKTSLLNTSQANKSRKNPREEDLNPWFRRCQTPQVQAPRKFLTLESEITVTSRSPSKNPIVFVENDFQADVQSQSVKQEDFDDTDAIRMEKAVVDAATVLNQINRENTTRNHDVREGKKHGKNSDNRIEFERMNLMRNVNGSQDISGASNLISRDSIANQSNTVVAKARDFAPGQSNLVVDQKQTLPTTIPLSPQGNNTSDSFKRRKKRRIKQEVRSHSALAEIMCTPDKNKPDASVQEMEVPERIKQFNPKQLRSFLGLQDSDHQPKEVIVLKKPDKIEVEKGAKKIEEPFEDKVRMAETPQNVLESSVKVRKSGSRSPRTKHRNLSADYTASHDSGISADLSSNKVTPSTSNRIWTRDSRNPNWDHFTSARVQRIDVTPETEFLQLPSSREHIWNNIADDFETRSGTKSGVNSRTNSGSPREVNEGPFRKNVFVEAAEIRREFYGHDIRSPSLRNHTRDSTDSLSMEQRLYDVSKSKRVPLSSFSAPQTPVQRSHDNYYHHKNDLESDDPTISDSDNYKSEVKDFLNTFVTITQPLEASTPRVSPQIEISEKKITTEIFGNVESETTDESASRYDGFATKERKYLNWEETEAKHQNETSDSIIIFADNASTAAEEQPFLEAEAKVLTLDASRTISTSFEVKRSRKRPQTPVLLRKPKATAELLDDLTKFEEVDTEEEPCGTRHNLNSGKAFPSKFKTIQVNKQEKLEKQMEGYETGNSEKLGTEKDEVSSRSYNSRRHNLSIDDLEWKIRDKVNDWITRNQNSEEVFGTNENQDDSIANQRDGEVRKNRKSTLLKQQQIDQTFTSRTITSETGIQCSLLDATAHDTGASKENVTSNSDVIPMHSTSFDSSKCLRTEATKKKLQKLIEDLENKKILKNLSGELSKKFNETSTKAVGDENSSRSSMVPINIHIENIHVEMPQNTDALIESGSVKLNGDTFASKEFEKLVMAILKDKGCNERGTIDGNMQESSVKELKENVPKTKISSGEVPLKPETHQSIKIDSPRLEITPRSPVSDIRAGTGTPWDETPVQGMSREPTFAENEWHQFENDDEDTKTPFNATFVKSTEKIISMKKPDEMKELMYSNDHELTPIHRSKTAYMKSEIGGISEASANMTFINSLRSTRKSQPVSKRISKSPKPTSKTLKNQQTNRTQGVGGISSEVADMTFFKSLREMKKSGEEKASRFRSKTPQPEVSKSMPVSTRVRAKTPDFIRQNIQSVSKASKSKSLQSSRENLVDTVGETNIKKNQREKLEQPTLKASNSNDVMVNAHVKNSEVQQLVVQSADISESTTDMMKSNVFDSVETIVDTPKTAASSFEPKTTSPKEVNSLKNPEGVSHTSLRSMKRRSNKARKASKIPLFKSPQPQEAPNSIEAEKVTEKSEPSSRARSLTPKPRKDTRDDRSKSRIAVPKLQSIMTV